MRVLVVHGSKRGGTAGLADMIAAALEDERIPTEVQPARQASEPDGYDAVIIAGSLYATRWHRQARRYARRHATALQARPVWLVASGPLDDSARAGDIEPVAQVARLSRRLGARGCITFGGRLAPDARGFPASAMAKTRAGDWRDPAQVAEFASMVAAELVGRPTTPA